MSKRPVGRFVGYCKFAVDQQWLTEKRERQDEVNRTDWHSKWVTVWRLKHDRLWTDGAIKKWLGEPITQGKYKVFSVDEISLAERKKSFKAWLTPRLEKKKLLQPEFAIKKLK
jgi:hypothetical protein